MKSKRILNLAAAVLVALSAGAVVSVTPGARAEEAAMVAAVESTQWSPKTADEGYPEEKVLLKIKGEEFTTRELRLLLQTRPMTDTTVRPETIVNFLRGEDLLHVGRHIAAHTALADQARAKLMAVGEAEMRQIETLIDRFGNALIYANVVTEAMEEPTDEKLMELYEANKAEKYAQKELLELSHIIVSTYETYTVKEGDTLTSVAAAISGDEKAFDRILSNDSKRPRVESYPKIAADKAAPLVEVGPPDGEKLPARALVEGEVLLVPVSAEKEAAAKARIEEAHARLKEGADFLELAKEYSDATRPGTLMRISPEYSGRDIMPELRATFDALGDGAFSDPIRTKHGYQIVYRKSYTPAGFIAFDQVRLRLDNQYRQAETERLVTDFFLALLANEAIATLHPEAIESAEPKPEDVLITVHGTDFTREELERATEGATSKDDSRTVDAFVKLAWRAMPVQTALIEGHKAEEQFSEMPMLVRLTRMLEDSLLAEEYLIAMADEKVPVPAAEEVRAAYDNNPDAYTVAESFDLYAAVLASNGGQSPEELKLALEQQLAGVQSLEQFKTAASAVNPKADRRFGEGGAMGTKTAAELGEETAATLRTVEAPGLSEVTVVAGKEAIAYWVESATAAGVIPFEEKQAEITESLHEEAKMKFRNELVATYRTEAAGDVELAVE